MANVCFQDPQQEDAPVCIDPDSPVVSDGGAAPAPGPNADNPDNNPLLACIDSQSGGMSEAPLMSPAPANPETCDWNSGVLPDGLNCPPPPAEDHRQAEGVLKGLGGLLGGIPRVVKQWGGTPVGPIFPPVFTPFGPPGA
jgi:hypothetical protein